MGVVTLRPEDYQKLKVSLTYKVRTCLKKEKKEKRERKKLEQNYVVSGFGAKINICGNWRF